MMHNTITGSIVLYKTAPERIEEILRVWSQASNTGILFLIDNSPVPNLYFRDKQLVKVKYIFNNANVGYGAGHNIAIRNAMKQSKYHVVINPDIQMKPIVLKALHEFMEENRDVGHVMPKILYPDGRVQYVCKLLPSPFDLFARRFLPRFLLGKSADQFSLKFTGYDRIMDVPYLSGCFMFLRIEALKRVGLFDERFFMYPEDIDLTRRIHKEFRTVFYPNVSVIHEHGAGSYKSLSLLTVHIYNIVKYFNKWGWFSDRDREAINNEVIKQLRRDD